MNEISRKLKTFLETNGQNVDDCLMYLLAKRFDLTYRPLEETMRFLQKNNFIMMDFSSGKIISTVSLFEGETINVPDADITIEQEIRDRIDEYRIMFKRVRPGSTGVKQKVIQMLTRFCLQNQVTFDQVLEATKIYMTYTDFHLISNADNFISKLDKSGEEISLLLLALEEQDMGCESTDRTYKVI